MNNKTKNLVFLIVFLLTTILGVRTTEAGVTLIQSFTEQNITGESYFGISVSTAGDVNNDNYDDVIVGAMGYNSSTGRAYIFYGGTAMDNSADVILDGENINDKFGYSVSAAGDVNNDNYADIIVVAYD